MKKNNSFNIDFRYWWFIYVLFSFISSPTNAEIPDSVGALRFAETFFKGNSLQFAPGKGIQKPLLEQRYQSELTKKTHVYAFQNLSDGFALVAQSNGKFAIVGYSPHGSFIKENLPPQFQHLISLYEDSLEINSSSPQKTISGSPVMTPLLNEAGINLNQFYHEEVGGCPSGCVATAFAQIMAYYKYPSQGRGSHCYTSKNFGEICVDFGNTTYNWVNPTNDDYKKLSYHVGVAMSMDYCGDDINGISGSSTWGNRNDAMDVYFKYYVSAAETTESHYIKNEIDHRRPVYIAVGGNPGHAMVLDGYDTDGLFHVNFGWGGQSNGYYILNSNSTFKIGSYELGTNILEVFYISPTPTMKTATQDSLALVAFHNAFNGTTGWDLSQPVYTWSGIMVIDGRVTELRRNNGYHPSYKGSIPPEIGNLTALNKLDLLGLIDGELPATIANLTELQELTISPGAGNLKAFIPENIGNLSNLEDLFISNNSEGTLPASMGNLTKLKRLSLSNGNLTGNIPDEIENLINLESIDLGKNKISGTIPENFANLTKLTRLNLAENQLSGSLPANIGNLTELSGLSLNDNQLSGTLPESMGNCSKLGGLNLSNNQLSGTLPESLGNCSKLVGLKLNNNQFSGEIPASLGNIGLTDLDLSNNLFSALPEELDGWNNVEKLDMSNNRLKTIPNAINNLVNLNTLYLNNNLISFLPVGFGFFPKLEYIDLSNNDLSTFPDEVCLLPELNSLYCKNNKLTAFPPSIGLMSKNVEYIRFENNDLQDSIPVSLLTGSAYVNLSNNRFRFEHIPPVKNAGFGLYNQKPTLLSKKIFKTALGDTLEIDIRQIAPFTLSDNEYYWYSVNNNKSISQESDPVLKLTVNEKTVQDKYFCVVLNPNSPKWTYMGYITNPCLNSVSTDTLSLQLATDEELISEKYDGGYVVASKNIPTKIVEDRIVTLVPPLKVRGTIQWQASADGKTWYDLTETMSQADLKANFVSVKQDELVLSPKTPAFYRSSVQDLNCEPLYSDTIKVNPFGEVLYDETLNVANEAKTIKADSIEVTLPQGIHNEDFRLTIVKLDNPPAAPADTIMSSVYDITVSFGTVFETPIFIKFKNIDKTKITKTNLRSYKAVYFDDIEQKWVPYADGGISLKDSSIVFETNHLTKVGWTKSVRDNSKVTDYFASGNIFVYYKKSDVKHMADYASQQTDQDWHISGETPIYIQDIAHFLSEVMTKFGLAGLPVPTSDFSVYVDSIPDDGSVGILGMIRGYMLINRKIDNPVKLRSLLAHEFMHYTQDDYIISSNGGNLFWMEANAHLADRIVWNDKTIPISESEHYLLDGRTASSPIYRFLQNSWDYEDRNALGQKVYGVLTHCYQAGTFLHYMRSYRDGDKKLNPATLLKNTQWFGSWRNYLNNYISTELGSDIGSEYENYVKYILSGENEKFTILDMDKNANPFSYIISASASKYFAQKIAYKFSKTKIKQKDNVKINVPYLASKMLILYNATKDSSVVVNYKRLHEYDDNHKVYYGKYDFTTKKMILTDISDKEKFNILIEERTDKTLKEIRNICFILFINKENPSRLSFNSDFDASFELNAFPVMDVENVQSALLSYGKTNSIPGICNYSNGQKMPFSMGHIGNKTMQGQVYQNITTYNFDRVLTDDSTFLINVEFADEVRLELGDFTLPMILKSNVTMRIEYNFIRGTIKITSNANTKDYVETTYEEIPRIVLTEQQTTNTVLWLKNLNTMDIFSSGKDVTFSTRNSQETQDAIELISKSVSGTSYSLTYGNQPPKPPEYYGYNYVSTDYSMGDILVVIAFKVK